MKGKFEDHTQRGPTSEEPNQPLVQFESDEASTAENISQAIELLQEARGQGQVPQAQSSGEAGTETREQEGRVQPLRNSEPNTQDEYTREQAVPFGEVGYGGAFQFGRDRLRVRIRDEPEWMQVDAKHT